MMHMPAPHRPLPRVAIAPAAMSATGRLDDDLGKVSTNSALAGREDLEGTLDALESHLADLGEALRTRDLAAIDNHSTGLHQALATAVDRFSAAARHGAVPAALRRRLVAAGAHVAAQRESLARATSALDRAIDVLMPREPADCYAPHGAARPARLRGSARA